MELSKVYIQIWTCSETENLVEPNNLPFGKFHDYKTKIAMELNLSPIGNNKDLNPIEVNN
jgi:hypothetical protein